MREEEEYTKILVKRISLVKADIVIVAGPVSRLAQKYLLNEGITLIVNVEQSHMARLARSLGTPVINSIGNVFVFVC